MNDGFVRSVRFFINNLRDSIGGYLTYPIIVCFSKWFGIINTFLCSVYLLMIALMVFALAMQQYIYFYKTSKSFSITSKNFFAACHVNKLLSSVIFTAMAWLIRCLINFYEFTPQMLGIVFLSSIFFGFLGEFCGMLLYKNNSKLGFILYIGLILVCTFYAFLFSLILFDNNIIKINIPADSFLLASALVLPVLSVIFFVINCFMVRNLEIRS